MLTTNELNKLISKCTGKPVVKEKLPRVYVACLAAYNSGKLHGIWIDCNQDAEDIWAEIEQMLEASPEPDAEEWKIYDHENWQSISINESTEPEKLSELASLLEKHGEPFGLLASYYSEDEINEEIFKELYIGRYSSKEEWVIDLLEQYGIAEKLKEIPIGCITAWQYLDIQAVLNDFELSGEFLFFVFPQYTYVFNCL